MDVVKTLIFLALVPLPVGLLITRWFKHSGISVSLVLGLFTITIESYLLGLLGLYSWSIPVIVLQSVVLWLFIIFHNSFHLPHLHLIPALFILLSVYINCQLIVPFGKITPQGISLYGAHWVDSTWHLSIINSLDRSIPPENPYFAGTALSNYHYLVDLQISLIHRLTGISSSVIYFQFFGPFYLLLLSILIYKYAFQITGRIIGGISALCLLMLGSNIYYLIPYFFPQAGITPSVAWVEFFSTKTVNYPLLVSLTIVLALLSLLHTNPRFSFTKAVVFGLLSGFLLGIKSHTAIVWVGALGIMSFFEYFRGNYSAIIIFITSIVTLSTLMFVTASGGFSIMLLNPLWFIKAMFESPEHLNTPDWELRRQTLLSTKSYLGVAKLYIQGMFWFIIINFGPLIPGIVKPLRPLLTGMIIISILLPLIFITRGTPWNSIQFIYIAFLPLTLSVSYLITRLYQHQKLISLLIFVSVFAVLLPGNKFIVSQYQNQFNNYNISYSQVRLINFLSSLPYGAVLSDSIFWDRMYLPAYSGKSFYLAGFQSLDSLSVDYSSRKNINISVLACKDIPPTVKYLLVLQPYPTLSPCTKLLFSADNNYILEKI